jgi:glycosyltransferase involved in cell wall biosynthesis
LEQYSMNDNHNGRLPKRHCMVVHKYYPVGETRVEREALALIDHGHEVDVICLRADGEPPIDNVDGVSIYRLPLKRHGRGGRAGQLLEYLAFFILVFGKLLALHRRRRLMPEFYASLTGSDMTSWTVRLVVWQEKFSCRFADHVITVTDIWKETLIKRGVPAHKVSVVMNLADARIFHHSPAAELRTKSEDCFNLIYHGTFTHRYGVDLILRAIDKVRRQIPGIHLTLLGGGELRDGLEELLSELNLHDHVYLSQDFIPAVKLPKMIRESDIGIVPNRSDIFTDGLLPTKLMEYVALGTPVIAARTPTIAAYFDETMLQFFRPGDVDDLAECILALHADRSRLTQFVRNSDMFNQKYNWTRVAADYVALVERLNSK